MELAVQRSTLNESLISWFVKFHKWMNSEDSIDNLLYALLIRPEMTYKSFQGCYLFLEGTDISFNADIACK